MGYHVGIKKNKSTIYTLIWTDVHDILKEQVIKNVYIIHFNKQSQ